MKQGWLTVLQRLHNLQNNKANASVNTSDSYSNQVFSNSNSLLSQWRWVNIEDTKPKNKKTASVYLSLARIHTRMPSEVCNLPVKASEAKGPGRSPRLLWTDNEIHTGHLHSSPSLTHRHANRHTQLLNRVACLLRQSWVECEVCIRSHFFSLVQWGHASTRAIASV